MDIDISLLFKTINSLKLGVSLISAISNGKVICSTINRGPINGSIFIQFMRKVNRRGKNKYILVDNATIHKTKELKDYMKDKTNKLIYNVPYNPKTNPIEQVFNKSKITVRQRLCDTYSKLERAINYSLKSITSNDLDNFYNYSFNV